MHPDREVVSGLVVAGQDFSRIGVRDSDIHPFIARWHRQGSCLTGSDSIPTPCAKPGGPVTAGGSPCGVYNPRVLGVVTVEDGVIGGRQRREDQR